MKFTTVFAVLATIATAVSATLINGLEIRDLSNAERLAKRLPLKAPTRTSANSHYHHPHPSGKPNGITGSCNTGPVQCCDTVTKAGTDVGRSLLDRIGLGVVASDVLVGMGCSPIHALGLGGAQCTTQTVCCDNNKFNGLVAIGCSPININLV